VHCGPGARSKPAWQCQDSHCWLNREKRGQEQSLDIGVAQNCNTHGRCSALCRARSLTTRTFTRRIVAPPMNDVMVCPGVRGRQWPRKRQAVYCMYVLYVAASHVGGVECKPHKTYINVPELLANVGNFLNNITKHSQHRSQHCSEHS